MPGNRQGFILQLPQDRRNIQPSENIQNPRAECLLVETVKLYQTMPYQLMAHFIIRAPPNKNNQRAYIENVARLTGIGPDEPLGIPSDKPGRWMALGAAMGIQECGTAGFDLFAMLRGWTMARG
jgi:hypothetical protein